MLTNGEIITLSKDNEAAIIADLAKVLNTKLAEQPTTGTNATTSKDGVYFLTVDTTGTNGVKVASAAEAATYVINIGATNTATDDIVVKLAGTDAIALGNVYNQTGSAALA